jgi:hypothetical protein
MTTDKLPEPEGICRFCKKPIYIELTKHEIICKFRTTSAT